MLLGLYNHSYGLQNGTEMSLKWLLCLEIIDCQHHYQAESISSYFIMGSNIKQSYVLYPYEEADNVCARLLIFKAVIDYHDCTTLHAVIEQWL